jgi:hypothetical protein
MYLLMSEPQTIGGRNQPLCSPALLTSLEPMKPALRKAGQRGGNTLSGDRGNWVPAAIITAVRGPLIDLGCKRVGGINAARESNGSYSAILLPSRVALNIGAQTQKSRYQPEILQHCAATDQGRRRGWIKKHRWLLLHQQKIKPGGMEAESPWLAVICRNRVGTRPH